MVDPKIEEEPQLDQLNIELDDQDRAHKNVTKKEATTKSTKKQKRRSSWFVGIILFIILVALIFISGHYALQMLKSSSNVQSIFKEMKPHVYAKFQKENTSSLPVDPTSIANVTTESAPPPSTDGQQRIVVPGEIADQMTSTDPTVNLLSDKKSDNEQALGNTLPNSHYTIVISSSTDLNQLLDYVKRYELDNYQIYEIKQYGEPLFKLIKGNYTSKDEAEKAIATLPEDVQHAELWIKSGAEIAQERNNKNN